MSKVYLFLAVLFISVTLALIAGNMQSVAVNFLSLHSNIPMALLVFKCFALGAASCFLIFHSRRKVTKIEQKKLEWKTEDAKLQTEIQSDKVHQLELQVQTLEAALDKALKKGK